MPGLFLSADVEVLVLCGVCPPRPKDTRHRHARHLKRPPARGASRGRHPSRGGSAARFAGREEGRQCLLVTAGLPEEGSVPEPQVFTLRSIVLTVLFGKTNEKLGRSQGDPGPVHAERVGVAVGAPSSLPRLPLSWRTG